MYILLLFKIMKIIIQRNLFSVNISHVCDWIYVYL